MYLSPYITKKSISKKVYRKVLPYIHNGKLTKGSKNLLQGYMIGYAQDQTKSIDEKMNTIFCSIFGNINKRNQDDINKAVSTALLPIYEPGLENVIHSYLTKKKYGGKTKKNKQKKGYKRK